MHEAITLFFKNALKEFQGHVYLQGMPCISHTLEHLKKCQGRGGVEWGNAKGVNLSLFR